MDREIAAIRLYLSSRSLHVSNDWLEGCVNFFRSDNSNGYGREQLEEFVLDQWKLADLREMGEICLPPNLAAKVKVTLPGKYSLQVESVMDIAAPCYSQLQKIRKVVTENLEVSETKPQLWEPRPTRMFKLMLCDGRQDIMGIEYRPIRKLDQALVPGCKVMVIGPVECRKGVVLLQEHNLQIIGGEVDSLLIPNALENLLARNLNLEENPQPYMNGQTPPDPVPAEEAVHRSVANTVVQPNRRVAQVAPMAAHDFNDDDDDLQCVELDEVERLERQFQREVDDIPEEMIIDEDLNFSVSVPGGWNVGSRHAATSGRTSNVRPSVPLCNRSSSSNELEQLQNTRCMSTNSNVPSVKGNIKSQSVSKVRAQNNNVNYQKPCLPSADGSFNKVRTSSFNGLDDFEVDDFEESRYSVKTSSTTVNPNAHLVDLLEQDDELLLDISSQDLDASVLPSQEEPTSSNVSKTVSNCKPPMKQETMNLSKKPIQRNQSKITSFISKNQKEISISSDAKRTTKSIFPLTAVKRPPSSPLKNRGLTTPQKTFLEQKKHKCVDEVADSHTLATNNQEKTFSALCSKRLDVQASSKLAGKMNDGVNECVMNRTETSVSCSWPSEASCSRVPLPAMEHKPFVYLSQLGSVTGTSVVTFTVKAFVLTLMSQLVLKKEGWHLLGKLNDGSALMQVVFSSQVLENLIGYTPAEMRVLRQKMATNPAIKEKIKQALLDAQKKLVNLNCLLDLTFSCDSEVPVVTAVTEVGKEHVELLSKRLLALSGAAGLDSGSL